MNSIRSLERALMYEIERQTKALENGEAIVQETRHWDEDCRRHEVDAFEGGGLRLPVLPRARHPAARAERRVDRRDPGDPARAAPGAPGRATWRSWVSSPRSPRVLVADRASSALFEETVALGATRPTRPRTGSRRTSPASLNKHGGDAGVLAGHGAAPRRPDRSGRADDTVSGQGAKQALGGRVRRPATRSATIVERRGLAQVSDTGALGRDRRRGPRRATRRRRAVPERQGGRDRLPRRPGHEEVGGSANPKLAQELLRERLSG